MKKIKVLKREVTERTGYKKFPFARSTQYIICYDGKKVANAYGVIDNPNLKINFYPVLDSGNKKVVADFFNHLGRTNEDKWLKQELLKIIDSAK